MTDACKNCDYFDNDNDFTMNDTRYSYCLATVHLDRIGDEYDVFDEDYCCEQYSSAEETAELIRRYNP